MLSGSMRFLDGGVAGLRRVVTAVAVKHLADAPGIQSGVGNRDEHGAILQTAAIIVGVFLADPMLGQGLIEASADRADDSANAHGFGDGRRGDSASGCERTNAGDGQRRDAQSCAQRAATQTAPENVPMVLVGDLAVAAGGRGRAAMVGDDGQVTVIHAECA